MDQVYPDHATYEALYARFLNEAGTSALIDQLGPLIGQSFLDLCGGSGRLTMAAFAAGATSATLLDREPSMLNPALAGDRRVGLIHKDILQALVYLSANEVRHTRAGCQQAINYWLTDETAYLVSECLSENGIFVFNTFNQKPAETPRVREYEVEGKRFAEVGWLVGDVVHHLQIREGLAPHYTTFRWISPEEYHSLLSHYFTVYERRQGSTSIYRCQKK